MTTTALPPIVLRGYQRDAILALHRAFAGMQRGTGSGQVTRAAVVLPTGEGKTVVFAHPSFRGPLLARGGRMLVLVHRDELATQAVAKLRGADPAASVGRVQATWDETDAQIIVASVQTLARTSRRERLRDVRLIVVDEAHHAVAPTYVQVLDHYGAFRGTPTAGFSATLARGADDGHLGDIWQEVVLRRDILDGIRCGSLVDIRGLEVQLKGLDLRSVRKAAGDYRDHDLSDALQAADAPEHVAQAYRELAGDRQGLAFWPDVASAQVGAEAMTEAGIPAEVIVGSTKIPEREAIYDRYKRGQIQVLSSCSVLTEGFDMPQASAVVVARPTQSSPLYVQMVGRALRPHRLPVPGYGPKRDALLIDVVGASGRHQLATMADLSVTIKQVKEGQSLAEAAREQDLREAEQGWTEEEIHRTLAGERVVRDVDLFAQSTSVWLSTRVGTNFIPAGGWTIFIWPATSGLWDVGVIPTRGVPGQARPVAQGLTLDWAVQQAEAYARQVCAQTGIRLDTRGASWRRSGAAVPKQLAYASSLGLHFEAGARKSDVSDAISIALATRALGG